MKAMILAAGLGTRLAPYSRCRPKPLFPVLDRPLLLWTIDQLRRHGAGPILVNAHHLREQMVDALVGQPVALQLEERELGTGGGLRRARSFLGDEPVLVVNGDIIHDIDLAWVYQCHRKAGCSATLVLHDLPRFNSVVVAADGMVRGFERGGGDEARGGQRLAFTGVAVIEPALLEMVPPARFFDVIDWYRLLIRRGHRLQGLVVHDHFWLDMGTPADYLALHGVLLGPRPPASVLPFAVERPVYLGRAVQLGAEVEFADWACVGSGAVVGAGARLARVVVWDGARVPAGVRLSDTIVV